MIQWMCALREGGENNRKRGVCSRDVRYDTIRYDTIRYDTPLLCRKNRTTASTSKQHRNLYTYTSTKLRAAAKPESAREICLFLFNSPAATSNNNSFCKPAHAQRTRALGTSECTIRENAARPPVRV
ncbi:MAG: hypothetical protein LBD07_05950, partial [Spirochaetaceae bacterium]|nr:hypothetical protein [Spirochaetaceae bacterium]